MGKAKIFYRQVATLAPNHQLGGYAKAVLRQIDPSFSGGQVRWLCGFIKLWFVSFIRGPATTQWHRLQRRPNLTPAYRWNGMFTVAPGEHGVWVDVDINGRRDKNDI
jgi:hypothetical protein